MSNRTIVSRQRLYTRRAFLIGGLKAGLFASLVARLGYLQLVQGDSYKTLADDNRIKLALTTPSRGMILDRHGVKLAVNRKNYRLFLYPDEVEDMKALIAKLERWVELDPEAKEKALKRFKPQVYQPPILIQEDLSWEALAHIETHHIELPGIAIDLGLQRYYPYPEATSHVLGHMGQPTDDEPEALRKLPGLMTGKTGVEKIGEETLRGTAGVREVEVNARGIVMRELSRKESVAGESITTTLDIALQQFTLERLGEESAGVVMMEIPSGEIRVMLSAPGFNANLFSKSISKADWQKLLKHPRHPLLNKSVSGIYPPGSTFKMLVGLAAVESGFVTKDTTVFCPGHFDLGSHRFNCWKPEGHGSVNLHSAIAESCDVYFYQTALKTGMDRIARIAEKFGLGAVSELGFPGEAAGNMPTPQWKQKRFRQSWQKGDTVNAGIGQGYVTATPLQLAIMTARLASGLMIHPTLIKRDANAMAPGPIGVSQGTLNAVREGMNAVVNTPGATAYGQRIHEPEYAMAGKTGTSQVRKIIVHGRNQNLEAWENRHHGLFVAYAPVATPKYAIAVVVEHGGSGAGAAAPIARDLLLKAQKSEGLEGSEGEEPA